MSERIVILGGGESGTGAAILAKAKGFDVFVSDNGQLKEKYKTELQQHSIEFEEGGHTEEKILKGTSLVIKSPGIGEKTEWTLPKFTNYRCAGSGHPFARLVKRVEIVSLIREIPYDDWQSISSDGGIRRSVRPWSRCGSVGEGQILRWKQSSLGPS